MLTLNFFGGWYLQEECQYDVWGLKKLKCPYFQSLRLFAESNSQGRVAVFGHKETIVSGIVSLWGFWRAWPVCPNRRCLGCETAAFVERASVAKRFSLFAAGFGQLHDQCVVFVVEGNVFGECLRKDLSNLSICLVALQDSDALENASGVGINDK